MHLRKHFVHIYRWGHEEKRKQFRRWAKDGKVILIGSTRDGFFYQEVEEWKVLIKQSRRRKVFKIMEREKCKNIKTL